VAGCAASIALARKGRNVALIERKPTPHHKVCGEFLSGEALEDLHVLGIVSDIEFMCSLRWAGALKITEATPKLTVP
jgi:flavin-dependent dehydrogenase